MGERYNIVGNGRNILYQKNCSVLLSAYNILLDTLTGDLLLQCKYENQTSKSIKAIFLDIDCFSVDNKLLDSLKEKALLDLNVPPFSKFGQNTAINLPNTATRSVKVYLKKVVFSDSTEIEYTGYFSEPFPSHQEDISNLNHLANIFIKHIQASNAECNINKWKFVPRENEFLYQCGCGNILIKPHTKCTICHANVKRCIELNNSTELTSTYNKQLKVKKQIEEENKIRNKNRNKKIKIVFSITTVIVIILCLINFVILPSIETNKAESKYGTITAETTTGDYVMLGLYEQDGKTKSKETLTWRVLDKEDDKLLLITEYVVDVQDYNNSKSYVSWEDCTLRKWLNEDFKNNCLTNEQKEILVYTTLNTTCEAREKSIAEKYSSITEDEIFILTSTELEKYFKNRKNSTAYPTEYAIENNIKYINTCWYWCRNLKEWSSSSGEYTQGEINGPSDISFTNTGDNINYGVRPAMWIDVSELK